LIVVDIDKNADLTGLQFPETVTVRTGSGGIHLYYTSDAPIGNTAGKLANYIDIRGTGGQVVAAGSVHKNGKVYEYILSPAQTAIQPLPQWIMTVLTTEIAPYIAKAIDSECQSVANATEGTRNDTMNRAAFALARFQADVPPEYLMAKLLRATTLPRTEAVGVIQRAFDTREPEKQPEPVQTNYILIPGQQQNKEIGTHVFTKSILDALPDQTIFKRGGIGVDIFNGQTNIIRPDKMRTIIDSHMRLGRRAEVKKEWKTIYVAASRDHANLVLSVVPDSKIKTIDMFSTFPIFTRNWQLAKPGWHDGVYYDEKITVKPGLHNGILEDILTDFPWATDADRENFIALMLTPIIRYAINGNAPMFLIKASIARTGKTKLAEEVMGAVFLGKHSPAMQMARDETEQQKRIMAMLMQGDAIIHIDNVNQYIDSEAIATLVTASEYRGRILGLSEQKTAPNYTTLIATANNPEASSEIVNRIVPITLQPKTDHPELRSDFTHPHCFEYVLQNRHNILAHLIAMVQEWQEYQTKSLIRLGGFEGWAKVIGGIMRHHGYDQFMSNWQDWKRAGDPTGNDLSSLIDLWWDKFHNMPISSGELCKLATEHDLFEHVLVNRRTDQAKAVSFSMRVMRKSVNTPVGNYIIKKGPGRSYYLKEGK